MIRPQKIDSIFYLSSCKHFPQILQKLHISIIFFLFSLDFLFCRHQITCTQNPGGLLGQKVYTPARTALRNPYPHWHKILKPLPSLAHLDQNPYPYWHKFVKRLPSVTKLLLKNGIQPWNDGFWCTVPKMWPFSANFDIFLSLWHNQWKNHTLSGTHLLLKTLPLVAHCLKTLPSVALKSVKKGPTPS